MSWLQELIDLLFCWVPRIWLVEPDEGGVRTTLGKHTRLTPPGWYFYWPIIHVCTKVTVTPQVVDLRGQSVLTRTGRDIIISGAIQYRISDAQKAILCVCDFDVSLRALALGIIGDYASKKTIEECNDRTALAKEILDGVREAAAGWGLKIMKVYITDLGATQNIRIVGNTQAAPIVLDLGLQGEE
jgi:regulator of protease activity HflC (stomatin/prohibitin superfamily)